ncbi:hypothetical protein ASD00_31165 [Ensifer sp. Root31]|nr:hypothetical protein ASD00_31165 [Ensifer sp. Root31]
MSSGSAERTWFGIIGPTTGLARPVCRSHWRIGVLMLGRSTPTSALVFRSAISLQRVMKKDGMLGREVVYRTNDGERSISRTTSIGVCRVAAGAGSQRLANMLRITYAEQTS